MKWALTVVAGCAAAIACASPAGAQTTYAAFRRATDTIRIGGNTTLNQADFTCEARIWLDGPFGHVFKEQQDAVEDKSLQLGENSYLLTFTAPPNSAGHFVGQASALSVGRWHHVAWVRSGAICRLYVDGIETMSATDFGAYNDGSNSLMSLGMFKAAAATAPSPSFIGRLDWIRISNVARYASDFAPPRESELISDAATQLLLRLNEPAGTLTLVDESPNHYPCNVGIPVSPGWTATAPALGEVDCSVNISEQPVDQSVSAGGSVLFATTVESNSECSTAPTFQWQRRNPAIVDPEEPGAWINLTDGGGFVNTHTSALGIQYPNPAIATGYRCLISSGCGCAPIYTDVVNFSVNCPADFDGNGGVDGGDLAAFFEHFEQGC